MNTEPYKRVFGIETVGIEWMLTNFDNQLRSIMQTFPLYLCVNASTGLIKSKVSTAFGVLVVLIRKLNTDPSWTKVYIV